MKKTAEKDVYLKTTVVYGGRSYPPGSIHKFPDDVANGLIDDYAADPVDDIAPSGSDQPPGATVVEIVP